MGFQTIHIGYYVYRYISENITNYINEGERKAGDTSFDYAKLKDSDAEYERENLVKEKGFFIRPSELFCNVIKAAKVILQHLLMLKENKSVKIT